MKTPVVFCKGELKAYHRFVGGHGKGAGS